MGRSNIAVPSLTTANGSGLVTDGCVWVNMAVGEGQTNSTRFVVVRDLADQLLIGLDTLRELKASIQCDELNVTVKRVPEVLQDRYQALFAKDSEDIGRVKGFQYRIDDRSRW